MARSPFKSGAIKDVAGAFAVDHKGLAGVIETGVKGVGNAILINKLDSFVGNPLHSLPTLGGPGSIGALGGILDKLPRISLTTVINYFLLNKFKININLYALGGALFAIIMKVNPYGTVAYKRTPPYIQRADQGLRGI